MPSLLVLGECMVELSPRGTQAYTRAFAGDTYNAAIYAKRWNPQLRVSYLSALGTGPISDAIVAQCTTEGSIDTSLIARSEDAIPGLYMIVIDANGERSFMYWCRNSAATQMIRLLEENGGVQSIPDVDYIYFSGITLAILSDDDKQLLLDLINSKRGKHCKVAFDPNYRPQMWRSTEHAKLWIDRAYQCSDLVFPGVDDHYVLFGHSDQQVIKDYLDGFGVREMVIKCGEKGVFAHDSHGQTVHLPFIAANIQVDSTAAGDSFAGTYIASRMAGKNTDASVMAAANIARFVVQHRGAIVEQPLYHSFMKKIPQHLS